MKKQGFQQPLDRKVLRFIRENHLLTPGCKLLVAVSGGPDSVCLLHLLDKIREELALTLHVAHLDHQLRGAESQADAEYVSLLSHWLGIPSTIETRDVKAYKSRHSTSPEEAAREVRYAFLAETAESVGAELVATGHTADDNVETILLHLIRGTGMTGLRGLQPQSRWQSAGKCLSVIRPLLAISRQETNDYCSTHYLEPRLDTSNLSLSPLRNRIRHQLLPLLKSYNPRINEAFLRTARIAGDEITFLTDEVARLWNVLVQKQGETVAIDRAKFLELPSGMRRHLLREAIGEAAGSLKDIEAVNIEEIIAAAGKQAGKSVNLPGGLVFTIEYDRLLLAPETAVLSPFPVINGEHSLKIPGVIEIPGWRIETSILKREQMPEREDDFTAYFDFEKTGNEMAVRCRQPGDRFQPLGMEQTKKVGEFMIDAKIPHAWRDDVPIVSSTGHLLWVVGWRIDDRAKVAEGTRQVLRLRFDRR